MSEVIDPAVMTLVSTTVTETLPEWSAVTPYAIGDSVSHTASKSTYQSAQASNTGNNPATSPSAWIKTGPTNVQAPFDDSYRTKSTRTGSITYVISTTAFTDRVAMLNLTGTAATVSGVKDGTTVYSNSFSLLNDSPIIDLWTYFYEPIVYIRDLIVDDIPTNSGVTYTLNLTGPGTVGLGLIRIGRGKFIGEAEEGSGVGTTRYSIPKFDEYGNYTPIKRASAKRGSFDMILPASQADAIKDYFDDLDITPIVFNMSADTRGKIWGFARNTDFSWFKYRIDKYRLEIEGVA